MVTHKESTEYTKVKDLLPEERQEVEEMLELGETPLTISKELNIPIQLIQSIRRMNSRPVDQPKTIIKESGNPTMQAIRQQLQDQVERTMLENQLEDLQEERSYKREKRRLELQQIRQDQRMQRMEMRLEYEGDEDEPEDEPLPQLEGDSPFSSVFQGENAWISDIIKFATTLKNKPPREATMKPTDTTPDFTKPLSEDVVREEIKKFTKEELINANNHPKLLESGLKARFPGILPENIKTVQSVIRHYVDNSKGTSNS